MEWVKIVVDIIQHQIEGLKVDLRFIDLFAGMGGTRIGFEQACHELNIKPKCVFSSEVKKHAISIYEHNFGETPRGDITKISSNEIPDFDYLIGGFPCQAFSIAGKRLGFDDTRGTLFFEIARILKEKKPQGFLLENVEGLVTHPQKRKNKNIGKTLETILNTLSDLGYKTTWKVLDASEFGVPQKRKRIYIVGHLTKSVNLENFINNKVLIGDILEKNLPCEMTYFKSLLLTKYSLSELEGKKIKDKRGGDENIHSWDIEIKGKVTQIQKDILNSLLKARRQKKWANVIGIDWMDGMPLTLQQIFTFFNKIPITKLENELNDLEKKGYLKLEYPKKLITENGTKKRVYDESKPKGYNIVTGKLSFEINEIFDRKSISNTLVATEMDKIAVTDIDGIRNLSERECLRFFGFPNNFKVNIDRNKLYDLIGNTVVVPVIKEVAIRLLK